MSMNTPNWQPVPAAPAAQGGVPPCGRCTHRASAHHDPVSCSARGRWWRRCRCSGYTRPEIAKE